ncbi:hypothetical protein HID58_084724 [Brassica napus]|uniref:Uncharacterized protein n=1 Tax=Brassica napus TaxID=3708 RepID=A0ABQ7XKI7_BRANA|nr:hypothetical protein HID58_084724 [Brassica napus]
MLSPIYPSGMKCSFTPGKWRVFIQIMGGVSLLAPSALHREVSSFTCIICDNSNSIGVLSHAGNMLS